MAVVTTPSNSKKQGSLVAGIGALVAIIAFLGLPYLKLTVTVINNSDQLSTPQSVSITLGAGYISTLAGLIWIEALLAIAVLVLAALLLLREAPFGVSATPATTQVRRAGIAVIILGIAGILYHFLFISVIGEAQMFSVFQSLSSNGISLADQLTQSHITTSGLIENAFGSWIYILGMGAAIVGGVLALQTGSRQVVIQPSQFPQYAQPYQPSQPTWPQPSQPLPQAWPQPSQPQPQMWPQPSQPLPQVWPQPSQPQPQMWPPTEQAQSPESDPKPQ